MLQKALDWVRRNLSLTQPHEWGREGVASATGEMVTDDSVLSLSAAWACVNLLAGTIASLPLMVYRTSPDGSRTPARDHPLYRVLHDSPNADQTALDFWEFGCACIELRGNMYARVTRAAGRVIDLQPIGVPVSVYRRDNGSLGYRWSEDGKSYDVGQEEVFHVRGFGGSPLGGLSTLSYGRQVFGLATAIDRAAGSTFANGLRPSGVLTMPGILKPDQRKDIENGLQNKFMGAVNAGRPMVLEGGTTWQQLTINPEDAQMLESRGFSVEEVCRFFGVPPFMVGHTEKTTSWGTGLEQQVLGFQKFTLRRRLKRIEQAVWKQLLSPADRAAGVIVEFNLEGLLRGDSKARAEFYTAALGDTQKPGWMVRNEVRALENLAPVPGWDEPVPMISETATNTPALPAPSAPANAA